MMSKAGLPDGIFSDKNPILDHFGKRWSGNVWYFMAFGNSL
jgi:hypothetical protein